MESTLPAELEGLRAKFETLLANGEGEAAFRRLANIWSAVQASREELQFKTGESCRRFALERAILVGKDTATRAIREPGDQLRRILNVGLPPLYEEVMLVLTRRVQIDLMVALGRAAFGPHFFAEGFDFDGELGEALKRKELRGIVKQARARILRNWGVPLRSEWA